MTRAQQSWAGDYFYYGFRLRSCIALKSLVPLPPTEAAADILLQLGEVPLSLPQPVWQTPFVQIGQNGEGLLTVGGKVRVFVIEGAQLWVNPEALTAQPDLEAFLQGAIAGIVMYQRKFLVLHGSCVAQERAAVALVGPAGRGKSTLAGALVAQGLDLVSDDLTCIHFSSVADPVTALVSPGPASLRLWPDAVQILDYAPEKMVTGREGHPKRRMVLPSLTEDLPVTALVRLRVDARLERPRLTRLTGMAALMPFEDILYRAKLGRHLRGAAEIFQDLTRLMGLAPVYSLTRTGSPQDLPELVALVRSLIGFLGPSDESADTEGAG